MQGIDPKAFKDMAKLRNANEADDFIRNLSEGSNEQELKSEYQSIKEVEELRRVVEKQTYLLHAFWIMLKEKGYTNEEFDNALNEAVLLEKRKDYKNTSVCPNCGKGLQAMENKPFASKCFYCGTEILDNPYKKFDNIDPYKPQYADACEEQSGAYISDDQADEQELKEAQEVISQSFEPYDVSKDLNFEDET